MTKAILSFVIGIVIGIAIVLTLTATLRSGQPGPRSDIDRPKNREEAVAILQGAVLATEDQQVLAVNILTSCNPQQDFEQDAAILNDFIKAGKSQRMYAAHALRALLTSNDSRPMPRKAIIDVAEREMKAAQDGFVAAVCQEYQAVRDHRKGVSQN